MIVGVLMLLGFALACTACGENKVKVTFVQNGEEAIVREVEVGGTLTDIPLPKVKDGYTVVWNRTDFSALEEALTVTAVETPNRYTITYVVGNNNATIEAETQTVVYDSQVVLYTPQLNSEKIVFKAWKVQGTNEVFGNGVYKVAGDITLVAEWEIKDGGEWSEQI